MLKRQSLANSMTSPCTPMLTARSKAYLIKQRCRVRRQLRGASDFKTQGSCGAKAKGAIPQQQHHGMVVEAVIFVDRLHGVFAPTCVMMMCST
eukprot:6068731-Amphidinium_carterae.1